jgi:hypothetical protein
MIENHHAVGFFAGRVYRVVDVDLAMRVFADAMRVAVFDIGRQRTPIVRDFVFDRLLRLPVSWNPIYCRLPE